MCFETIFLELFMLTIDETMTSIVARLRNYKRTYIDVQEIKREISIELDENDEPRTTGKLLLSVSCVNLGQRSFGSAIVNKIKKMNLKNKPSRVGFELNGLFHGTFCDPTEVLILCYW